MCVRDGNIHLCPKRAAGPIFTPGGVKWGAATRASANVVLIVAGCASVTVLSQPAGPTPTAPRSEPSTVNRIANRATIAGDASSDGALVAVP